MIQDSKSVIHTQCDDQFLTREHLSKLSKEELIHFILCNHTHFHLDNKGEKKRKQHFQDQFPLKKHQEKSEPIPSGGEKEIFVEQQIFPPRKKKKLENEKLPNLEGEDVHETSITKNEKEELLPKVEKKNKKKGKMRNMDWTKYSKRHIAIKVAYLGWNYHGLASQKDVEETIEGHLFNAIKKVKLIPEDAEWQSISYARCGRTDKGVSAFSQVVSFHARSNIKEGKGIISVGKGKLGDLELDYGRLLNRALPKEIRVLGWTPVDIDFSARFSTISRQYKYFFLKRTLDIDRMREAGLRFLGTHDFRNFCKMDVQHVTNYERTILHLDIQPYTLVPVPDTAVTGGIVPDVAVTGGIVPDAAVTGGIVPDAADMFRIVPDAADTVGIIPDIAETVRTSPDAEHVYVLTVTGSAFLWHQIRCMMAVLFLIGEHLEAPEVITSMLDISTVPRKPLYELAESLPLVLYDCVYQDIQWNGLTDHVVSDFEELWAEKNIEAHILHSMMHSLQGVDLLYSLRNFLLKISLSLLWVHRPSYSSTKKCSPQISKLCQSINKKYREIL